VILNDIQTVITGKPAGDPSKRDPEGKVFKALPYKGIQGRTYWATLPEGPMTDAKEAVKEGLQRKRPAPPAAPAAQPTAQQPTSPPTSTGTTQPAAP
jgi:hypothetical protein